MWFESNDSMTVALCWPEPGIQCYKTFIWEDNYLVERLWVSPAMLQDWHGILPLSHCYSSSNRVITWKLLWPRTTQHYPVIRPDQPNIDIRLWDGHHNHIQPGVFFPSQGLSSATRKRHLGMLIVVGGTYLTPITETDLNFRWELELCQHDHNDSGSFMLNEFNPCPVGWS